MPGEIAINLAVEDELSEHLLRALLAQSGREFLIGAVYGRQGYSYLKRMLSAFNNAARGGAFLVMADLDSRACVPEIIEDWFRCSLAKYPSHRHPNLMFRVAVREAEAWVMADREQFAAFLGVPVHAIPVQPDDVSDPKALLLQLAKKCRSRDLREDLVPGPGDKRIIGPDYNGRLAGFVYSSWRAQVAQMHSPSLAKAWKVLRQFHPIFTKRS